MIINMHMMNWCAIRRSMRKQQLYQVFDIDTCGWWLCNPEYSECVEMMISRLFLK
mgnify:CR=1 FL=1